MLKIALQYAEKAEAKRITDIHVDVGEIASYVDDSIQFYWDIISEGTIAQGAKLHFNRIPLMMQCQSCQEEFHPDGKTYACPKCSSNDVKIISGDDLQLSALDIDKDETPVEEVTQ